jgi:hypothetical protein
MVVDSFTECQISSLNVVFFAECQIISLNAGFILAKILASIQVIIAGHYSNTQMVVVLELKLTVMSILYICPVLPVEATSQIIESNSHACCEAN